MDLNIYKVDLDTQQPNGGKGESPRSAFTKYNNSLDTINGELTTLGESVDTINGELTTLDGSAMKKADNLSDLTNASTARVNLGLGTASLANTTTGTLDNTDGRVLKVRDHGIGSYTTERNYNGTPPMGGFYSFGGEGTEAGAYSSYINVGYHQPGYGFQILMKSMGSNLNVGDTLMVRRHGDGGWGPFVHIYHSGNTTVDGNGFIKRASPIVNLFSNSIEKTEHLEIAETELERLGVGHYVLHNAPLLSRDGWYIETPKDRNNNIYFYLDYDENETDKTLTIKTYKPDYSTGRAKAGVPMDIIDGRFVSLRFEEDPSLYPELEEPETEEE